jgi:hypothetical protein
MIEVENTVAPESIAGPAKACLPNLGCIEIARRATPLKI